MLEKVIEELRRWGEQAQRLSRGFALAHGLHPGDAAALMQIVAYQQRGQQLTTGALAEVVGVSPGAATGIVDRLSAGGHVERRRDHADRRRVYVDQGEASREPLEAYFGGLAAHTRTMMADYSTAELGTILQFLIDFQSLCEEYLALQRPMVGATAVAQP